jgi:hypothetical protein
MPVNSTLLYIKGLLDGLAMPPGIANMTAYITPPAVDEAVNGEPRAYIWTPEWSETRAPERGGSVNRALVRPVPGAANQASGVKALDHSIHIYIIYDQSNDDPQADSLFPSILDAVSWTLRVSTDPAVVTDPYDGTITQLVDVGEMITGQMNVSALASERMYRYDALLVVPVTEILHS